MIPSSLTDDVLCIDVHLADVTWSAMLVRLRYSDSAQRVYPVSDHHQAYSHTKYMDIQTELIQ